MEEEYPGESIESFTAAISDMSGDMADAFDGLNIPAEFSVSTETE